MDGLTEAQKIALENRILRQAYDNSFQVLTKKITFEELMEEDNSFGFSTLLAYDPHTGIRKHELESIIAYYVGLDEPEYYLRCAKLKKIMDEKYPEK